MRGHRLTAAVIGATGFIGRRLAPALVSGRIPVTCFTRRAPFLEADGLAPPLRTARVVYYLATTVNPAIAEHSPDRITADHELFSRLLGQLAALDCPPLVVLASSGGAVYDPDVAPPYAEDAPTRPASAYGAAKLALEEVLKQHGPGLPGVVLRLANVYGPGQRTGSGLGVIAHWLESAADGRPLTILGDPRARRDYVYVDDVVAAMVRLYHLACPDQDGGPGATPAINIGSGVPTSLEELRTLVEARTGCRRLAVEHAGARKFDRRDVWLDTTYAAQVLKWRSQTALPDGISRTWRALRAPSQANDWPPPVATVSTRTSLDRRLGILRITI